MAKAPKASTLALTAPPYTAAQALADSAYQIDTIENLEESFAAIIDFIITAANERKVTEINIKQASGIIPSDHPNWVTIRQRLRAADRNFTVASNPRTGYPTVSW